MSAVRRFLYEAMDAIVVDGSMIPAPSPEVSERNKTKTQEAIRRLGKRWCLWNPRPPIDLAAANDEMELAAHSRGNE